MIKLIHKLGEDLYFARLGALIMDKFIGVLRE
jgi:hypothetical protein